MDYAEFAAARSLLHARHLRVGDARLDPTFISGVLDLAPAYDVFLFSVTDTLMCGGQTMPSAAVAIPALRRLQKRIGIFCLDENVRKKDLLNRANRFGFSVSKHEILRRHDFDQWEDHFPLSCPHRTLMICSDPIGEVSLAQFMGMHSLLVTKQTTPPQTHLNICANYYANRV